MSNSALIKSREAFPSLLEDFFKPWSPWHVAGLENTITVPVVNVMESKDNYQVSLAAPGLRKNDFKIDLDGNMLIISSEKEEEKQDNDTRYTRKEYSYSSFSRSFNLPEGVNQDKIEASYQDGILRVVLPKKEESKKLAVSKNIAVK